MFWISIIGTTLTVGAVAFTLRHSWRARTASEAARDAATATATRLDQMGILIDVVKLCQICERVVSYIRDKNFAAAAISAFELRGSIIEFSPTATEAALVSKSELGRMRKAVADVHDVLEGDIDSPEFSSQAEECLRTISRVSTGLHKIKASAARQLGGRDASSR